MGMSAMPTAITRASGRCATGDPTAYIPAAATAGVRQRELRMTPPSTSSPAAVYFDRLLAKRPAKLARKRERRQVISGATVVRPGPVAWAKDPCPGHRQGWLLPVARSRSTGSSSRGGRPPSSRSGLPPHSRRTSVVEKQMEHAAAPARQRPRPRRRPAGPRPEKLGAPHSARDPHRRDPHARHAKAPMCARPPRHSVVSLVRHGNTSRLSAVNGETRRRK